MRRTSRRILLILILTTSAVADAALHAQPPQPAQEEFVPIDELDESDALPAARFLITAYAVVWGLLLWYVWSLWRRLARVEREMADLARQLDQRNR